jgi:hypothetical protein
MKVYALGNDGFVSSAVCDAIGDKPWTRQARVLIIAASKAAAVRIAAERGMDVSPHSGEFRQASGNDVDALRVAGFCEEPAVLVTSTKLGGDLPVARLEVGGAPQMIGTLTSNYPRNLGYTFTPSA